MYVSGNTNTSLAHFGAMGYNLKPVQSVNPTTNAHPSIAAGHQSISDIRQPTTDRNTDNQDVLTLSSRAVTYLGGPHNSTTATTHQTPSVGTYNKFGLIASHL